jgi:hypothetical protein
MWEEDVNDQFYTSFSKMMRLHGCVKCVDWSFVLLQDCKFWNFILCFFVGEVNFIKKFETSRHDMSLGFLHLP